MEGKAFDCAIDYQRDACSWPGYAFPFESSYLLYGRCLERLT